MKKAFYAIKKGHQSGIVVTTWAECKVLVDGCKGAIFKGFADYQRDEADHFAKHGNYGKHTPKAKPKRTSAHSTPHWPCLERKSYTDSITGVYYKNRCIRRQGPIAVGVNYVEPTDTGCPF